MELPLLPLAYVIQALLNLEVPEPKDDPAILLEELELPQDLVLLPLLPKAFMVLLLLPQLLLLLP